MSILFCVWADDEKEDSSEDKGCQDKDDSCQDKDVSCQDNNNNREDDNISCLNKTTIDKSKLDVDNRKCVKTNIEDGTIPTLGSNNKRLRNSTIHLLNSPNSYSKKINSNLQRKKNNNVSAMWNREELAGGSPTSAETSYTFKWPILDPSTLQQEEFSLPFRSKKLRKVKSCSTGNTSLSGKKCERNAKYQNTRKPNPPRGCELTVQPNPSSKNLPKRGEKSAPRDRNVEQRGTNFHVVLRSHGKSSPFSFSRSCPCKCKET